jgi:hypothetical protein
LRAPSGRIRPKIAQLPEPDQKNDEAAATTQKYERKHRQMQDDHQRRETNQAKCADDRAGQNEAGAQGRVQHRRTKNR